MQRNGRIILVSILVLLACISMVNAAAPELIPGTTSYYGVIPDVGDGNAVTCSSAGCEDTNTLPIEVGADGTYDGTYCIDATHCITINAYDAFDVAGAIEENSIDWSSNFNVECVVLKGADGYDTYYCTDGHKQADGSMSTPIKTNNYKASQISHILICYIPPDYYIPEFPSWFMSLMGIAGLVGMLVAFHRK